MTKEHIIPHGLLRRLEELRIRPNQAWFSKKDIFYQTKNPVIGDMCEGCQKRLHDIFDNRVDSFFTHIKTGLNHAKSIVPAARARQKMTPLEIEVEEPWFTLYMLRIVWNMLRQDKRITDFQTAFKTLKNYVLDEANCRSIPENTFIGLTYKPPVNYRQKGIKSPLFGLYYANPLTLNDGTPLTRISLDLVCYRLLLGEVGPSHASRKTVKNYFRNVMKKQNGISLKPNEDGIHKYNFDDIDPILRLPWGTPTDKLMMRAKKDRS